MRMSKTSEVVSLVEKNLNFQLKTDNANYMYGYLRGLLSHMERKVPGVAEELQEEIRRQSDRYNNESLAN